MNTITYVIEPYVGSERNSNSIMDYLLFWKERHNYD